MRIFLYIIFLVSLSSCSPLPEAEKFDFFLNEPCMITNLEQNNLIEGTQLRVLSYNDVDSSITLKLPKDFEIDKWHSNKWTIGWGTKTPYFDAGVENQRRIKKIDLETGKIYFGDCWRGEGFPRVGQRIVFWNLIPSNYFKLNDNPIIKPEFWPEFNGESIGFSSVIYDEKQKLWITLVNEVDSDKIQIYVATSPDLIHWKAGNDGKPILKPSDFASCSWTSKHQTPMVSEIIKHEGEYFIFMDAEDQAGKRHIGLATSSDLLDDYRIAQKPILSPQSTGTWNDERVFCAKVAKRRDDFILFFDGRNKAGYEQIGRAVSTDLKTWKMDTEPVLDQHVGWRSAGFTSEPSYVEVHGDTIMLMAAGAKTFQESFWHNHFTHRNYLDQSGNVNDAQLGAFISKDGGKTFNPHVNNPIFVNSYARPSENEHMGGNFERIITDSLSYIIYQAKSSSEGMKYSIFLRFRPM